MTTGSSSSLGLTETGTPPALGADNPNRYNGPNLPGSLTWPRLTGEATAQDFSPVVCSWCQRQILAGNPDLPISHGVCSPCAAKLRSAK